MKRYQDFIVDANGQPLVGASVTVTLTGGSTPATLYSDDGVTVARNPVLSDGNGYFFFYVADGVYDLAFSGPGLTPWTLPEVEIYSFKNWVFQQ